MIVRPLRSTALSLASVDGPAQLACAWGTRPWTPQPGSGIAGWLLITQPDHAALSGEFARHWGNELFPLPVQRAKVISAITHHDDGWQERDGEPRWLAATGGPQNFLDLEPHEFTTTSRRSIALARARSPLGGYLVSWHFLKLAEARSAVDNIFVALPEVQEFTAEQRELQSRLRPEFAALDDQAVAQACRLLQFADRLSIYICLGALEDSTFPQQFLTRTGSPVQLALHFEPESTVLISPYPFDCSPLRIEVEGRRLNQSFFRNPEQLTQAYAKASTETLSIEIQAGAK